MISFFRSIFWWGNFETDDFEENSAEEIIVDTPDNSPLIDNQWLNGSEIADHIRRVAEKNKVIRVMEPEYFIHGEPTASLKEYISNTNNWLMKSMTSATHIMWPVSKQNHWYLMIISKNEDDTEITIRCLDGFNTTETHKILFKNMAAFLQEVFVVKDKKYDYKFKSIKVREQDNGDDCGVVVCHYAEKFCQAFIAFQKSILGADELFELFEPALAGEFSGADQNIFLKCDNASNFDDACAKESDANPKPKSYLVERKRVRNEESSATEGQHVRKKPR